MTAGAHKCLGLSTWATCSLLQVAADTFKCMRLLISSPMFQDNVATAKLILWQHGVARKVRRCIMSEPEKMAEKGTDNQSPATETSCNDESMSVFIQRRILVPKTSTQLMSTCAHGSLRASMSISIRLDKSTRVAH